MMADKDNVTVDVVGWDVLPSDKRDWGSAKRVVFEVKVNGRGADHDRAPGFLVTIPLSADWFDDQDVIEIARSRAHEIFAAAADATKGWGRPEGWFESKRMPEKA